MTQQNLHVLRNFMILNGFTGKIYAGFGERFPLIIRIKGNYKARKRLDRLLQEKFEGDYQIQGLGITTSQPKGKVQIVLPKHTGFFAWCKRFIDGCGYFFFDRE